VVPTSTVEHRDDWRNWEWSDGLAMASAYGGMPPPTAGGSFHPSTFHTRIQQHKSRNRPRTHAVRYIYHSSFPSFLPLQVEIIEVDKTTQKRMQAPISLCDDDVIVRWMNLIPFSAFPIQARRDGLPGSVGLISTRWEGHSRPSSHRLILHSKVGTASTS
jgi:hypothetical protein